MGREARMTGSPQQEHKDHEDELCKQEVTDQTETVPPGTILCDLAIPFPLLPPFPPVQKICLGVLRELLYPNPGYSTAVMPPST